MYVSFYHILSVHAWKLAELCVCVALNNGDVMRGAHENVCATACVCLCVSCVGANLE